MSTDSNSAIDGRAINAAIRIPLVGKSGGFVLIDQIDLDKVSCCEWRRKNDASADYAVSATKKKLLMHRLILGCLNKPDMEVDHRNGNGLDNRRTNIRICTTAQNQWNQKPRDGSSSKFKGVRWSAARKKWFVSICANKRIYWIGSFSDENEAARAWDAAAIRLHGDFARLNFPPPRIG